MVTTGNVLLNDIDADTANADLKLLGAARPSSLRGGSVVANADKTLTYTPPRDFSGMDYFTYWVDDGQCKMLGLVIATVSKE